MARTAFKIGCYLAFFTAALHTFGAHVVPAISPLIPANDTERQLMDLATNYRFSLPGAARSMKELTDGFSLAYSMLFALTGGLGLIVFRRSASDPLLLTATARALAGGYLVLLAISLTYFFLIPTACTGAIALAFTIAAVSKPTA
jgi:hypothetical protein